MKLYHTNDENLDGIKCAKFQDKPRNTNRFGHIKNSAEKVMTPTWRDAKKLWRGLTIKDQMS